MTKTTTRCFRDAKIVNLYEATPDARGFFESVLGFSGLDGGFFRVSAADQRRYFGRVPFGKCAIQVGQDGIVEVIKSKGFGRDFDSIRVYFDHASNCFRSNWDNHEVPTPGNI